MTAIHGDPLPQVLVPHWLTARHRDQLAAVLHEEIAGAQLHPVAAIRLQDVLTELHVAAARDAVWPASADRVRRATGWEADVLPVRLSAEELAGVLAVPTLSDELRAVLSGVPA
ncbi:hypothetical protein ACI8AF_16155 [Blastococcus sp. SYSU D00669]